MSSNRMEAISETQHRRIEKREMRMVQNFTLIWLDAKLDGKHEDVQQSLTELRRIVTKIDTFITVDECLDFIDSMKQTQLLLIISGALGHATVPQIHDRSNVQSIFVFCENGVKHEEWTSQWQKIRGVFTRTDKLCKRLKEETEALDRSSMPLTVTSGDLNHLEPSFMYTQLIKEILLEMDYDDNAMDNLVSLCQDLYKDNEDDLKIIDEFRRDYPLHTPVWWYTRECFTYRVLNQALRNQEITILIKIGFFLRDVHQQIENLHSEDESFPEFFVLYRGQGMSTVDFDKVKSNPKGLISFNSFLSTSVDKEVSMTFARLAIRPTNVVGILFRMKIDQSKSQASFISLRNISYYGDQEAEVLFTMHTVFRIGDVRSISPDLWEIDLTLSDKGEDKQLHQLTDRLRSETEGRTPWHQLAKVFLKTGDYDQAAEIYRMLLEQTESTNDIKQCAFLYHQLALTHALTGDYSEALNYYHKALKICRKCFPPTHPDLASSYSCIGGVYDNTGEYSKALEYHHKALDIRVKALPHTQRDLASTYSNIGGVYGRMGEYSKALEYHHKARDIRIQSLPPIHPDLAATYCNIGGVYGMMGEYSKALEYNEKALEIRVKVLPPTHPNLATSYSCVGSVYDSMGEYSKALEYHHKALEICEKCDTAEHLISAAVHRNLAVCLKNSGNAKDAHNYGKRAVHICEKSLGVNHPRLAFTYNTMGEILEWMTEYNEALLYCKKALMIQEKTLSVNHPDLATSLNTCGSIKKNLGELSEAMKFHERALKIRRSSLPAGHPDIAASLFGISCVYQKMWEYSKASASIEEAIEIARSKLSDIHPDLQMYIHTLKDLKAKS